MLGVSGRNYGIIHKETIFLVRVFRRHRPIERARLDAHPISYGELVVLNFVFAVDAYVEAVSIGETSAPRGVFIVGV